MSPPISVEYQKAVAAISPQPASPHRATKPSAYHGGFEVALLAPHDAEAVQRVGRRGMPGAEELAIELECARERGLRLAEPAFRVEACAGPELRDALLVVVHAATLPRLQLADAE
jgi:hypothetical protein